MQRKAKGMCHTRRDTKTRTTPFTRLDLESHPDKPPDRITQLVWKLDTAIPIF